jgi:hypothetical protein
MASRAVRLYLATQAESGHMCPITMTHACIGALRSEPALLARWLPKIQTRTYDPRPLPGVARLPQRSPAAAPVLTGIRAVTLTEGEARLLIDGAERVVRPGDSVGADLVTACEPGLAHDVGEERQRAPDAQTVDANVVGLTRRDVGLRHPGVVGVRRDGAPRDGR